ncbi:MAG TPA: ComEC/Rec2 family competence protein [Prolixibacteraceae bacterium]|jgi:competence protein ComEC
MGENAPMIVSRSFFQRIPFIRISSLFLIGILINHYLQIDFYALGILLTLLLSILIFMWNNSQLSGIKIQNLLIILSILVCGMLYPNKINGKYLPTRLDQKDYFLAEICQRPLEKAKTYQSILWIQGRSYPKNEKVIVYFSKEKFDTTLKPGDQVILFAKPQEIKNMGNPFEFDYQSMMHNKGIDFSIYLSPGTYRKTGLRINRFRYLAEQARDKLVTLLAATKIENEECAVISALTLGYRAELDPETLNYFVNTGTIHVLSVSGLHVALIFLILSFLFSGMNKGKFGAILYPTLLLLFLWIYAFITGFSPPVQRSTVMFSFVIIGKVLRRPVTIYNSLLASALVLILLDPNVLFDIGFQLSYLSIFGIVLLQPPLESMIKVKNKSLKWAWTLLAVSMAAQLITFPLSILYFNQFPNMFWLSNYCAIPGTTILMWLTFGFFITSPIPFISGILAQIIQFTTNLMLLILKWISELPHAVIHGIVLSPIQTSIMYACLFACIIYGFSKNKTWLFGSLILLITLQISALYGKYELFNLKSIYVYNSKNSLIHLVNGRSNYIVCVGKYKATRQEINMIQNVCNHLKLQSPKFIELTKVDRFDAPDLRINDKTLRFLNCRINYSDQLKFTIQATDLMKFRRKNPELSKNEIVHEIPITRYASLNGKITYAINFTAHIKKAVCVFLE